MTAEVGRCRVCGCELLPGEGAVCARDLAESERRLLAAQQDEPAAWVMHVPVAERRAGPAPPVVLPPPASTAVPAEVLAGGRELASFSARFVGFLIDVFAWFFTILFVTSAAPLLGGLLFLATPLVLWAFNAAGWSPGRGMMGMRTVNRRGQAPGVGRGLVRTLAVLPSIAFLGLGYLVAAWDPAHQTFHDMAAGTYVVSIVSHRIRAG